MQYGEAKAGMVVWFEDGFIGPRTPGNRPMIWGKQGVVERDSWGHPKHYRNQTHGPVAVCFGQRRHWVWETVLVEAK